MATNASHIPYLDGWRGMAIAFLLVGHFFPVPGINLGAVGVNLFFVLSGLLMARILFVKNVDLPTFYRRRIARIVPSVAVYILAVVGWLAFSGRAIDWAEVAAAATFTNNYFQSADNSVPLGHIWSLSVEEHGYVILSLLALLVRRRMLRARPALGAAALATAACAFVYWMVLPDGVLGTEFKLHTEVAAFGIFLSGFLAIGAKRPTLPAAALAVCALAAVGLALHWWWVPAALKVTLGCAAFALALNLLDRAPGFLHAALEIRPLRLLGTWSFSIYLWQQPFYLMVHNHGLPPAAGLAISLALGIAAFHLIENPARLYLNRVWTGRKRVAAMDEVDAASAPPA